MLLHRHHVLHQHLALVGKHAQHAPFFSRIPPGHHLHGVIPADIHSLVFSRYCSHLESLILKLLGSPLPRPDTSAKVPPAPATLSSKTSSRAVHAPPDRIRGCPPARRDR